MVFPIAKNGDWSLNVVSYPPFPPTKQPFLYVQKSKATEAKALIWPKFLLKEEPSPRPHPPTVSRIFRSKNLQHK